VNNLPTINPKQAVDKICNFIADMFRRQHFSKVILGLSGGADSVTCLYLLTRALDPKTVFPVHLPYYSTDYRTLTKIVKDLKIPPDNFQIVKIKKPVDQLKNMLLTENISTKKNKIRLGNIMARVRMIILFDLARKIDALVCGTENKSEHLLGYFTRFGDGAADIEPIQHLYKTQVYQLAKYLKVPKPIISQKPTAGLWKGQTDEGQFGFTYKEADTVLSLYFDQKKPLSIIDMAEHPNAKKIITMVKNNQFKQQTPYTL